jgi:WD40 repeat protein
VVPVVGASPSASYDNTLKVWNVETGNELHTLNGHTFLVNGVALSGDGASPFPPLRTRR